MKLGFMGYFESSLSRLLFLNVLLKLQISCIAVQYYLCEWISCISASENYLSIFKFSEPWSHCQNLAIPYCDNKKSSFQESKTFEIRTLSSELKDASGISLRQFATGWLGMRHKTEERRPRTAHCTHFPTRRLSEVTKNSIVSLFVPTKSKEYSERSVG